jgi:tagatose-1,6-bisphosphate aldolase non-catalytic subunit AgaZ/GatZ
MGALQMEPTGLEMELQQQGADEEHLPRERLVLGGDEVMDCYWVSWELLLTLQHLQAWALALIAQEQ